jgi:DNA-binding NtrC family response regulator
MKPKHSSGVLYWLSQSQLPVFMIDQRRRVRFFNAACEEFFQCKAEEIIGKISLYSVEMDDVDPSHAQQALRQIAPPPEIFETTHLIWSGQKIGNQLRAVHFLNLASRDSNVSIVLGTILPGEPSNSVPNLSTPAQQLHRELLSMAEEYREEFTPSRLVAHSPLMKKCQQQWDMARISDVPVCFQGPRGCGKTFWARSLHHAGLLSQLSFVPIACAHITTHEFKHLLKAFATPTTSAFDDDPGAFYLKAIDKLSSEHQIFLLDAIRNRSSKATPIRIFSSTLQPLVALVTRGEFNEELYHALTPLVIELPALKERRDDLPLLVQYFIEQKNAKSEKQVGGCTPEVMESFTKYHWPGNLRELQETLHEAHTNTKSSLIEKDDLPFRFRMGWDQQALGPRNTAQPVNLEAVLAQIEREWIDWALECCAGNRAATAQLLGMTRPRLYRRLEALGYITPDEPAES